LLGDQIGNAWQAAQLEQGNYAPQPATVTDLFAGAIVPGFLLVALYIVFLILVAWLRPHLSPAVAGEISAVRGTLLLALVATLGLILVVLGGILRGLATPTEAAAIGAVGALALALWRGGLDRSVMTAVVGRSAQMTSMIFLILVGATLFSLVFRGFGG